MSRLNDEINQAIKLYQKFRGHNPSRIVLLPDLKIKTAVKLGKLIGLIYESDRDQKGKMERYIHFTKRPYPNLMADTRTHRVFTIGGKMKVTKRGLVN